MTDDWVTVGSDDFSAHDDGDWETVVPAAKADKSGTLMGIAKAGAQSLVSTAGGLVRGVGEMVQGTGTGMQETVRGMKSSATSQAAIMDAIDRGTPPGELLDPKSPTFDPAFVKAYSEANQSQRAAMRAGVTDASTRLANPDETAFSKAGASVKNAGEPVAQAGESVTAFGERQFPLTDEEQQRFSVKATKMTAGLLPYLGAAALGGMPAVLGLAGVQGYGDTYDTAKKSGASDEDAAAAGLFSGLSQAGLMTVPVGQAMEAMSAIPGAFKGQFLKTVVEMAKSGVALTAFSQLSTLADNVVAKNTYDPSRQVTDGLGKDIAATFAAGALVPAVGAVGGAALRRITPKAPGGGPDGPPPPPPGVPPEIAAQPINPADVHPGDAESPIPTEIIAAGRKKIREATSAPAAPIELGAPSPDHEALFDDENRNTQIGWYNSKTGEVQRLDQPAAAAPPAAPIYNESDQALTPRAETPPEDFRPISPISDLPAETAAPTGDGTRAAPMEITHPDHLEAAREVVNTDTTPGQDEAGNYQSSHVKIQGLDITIQKPVGAVRTGTGPDGKVWESPPLVADYGHIKGTKSADGEPVDVFVGPNPTSSRVFVIDQKNAETGAFDEHKSFVGFDNREQAVAAYQQAFSDGKAGARFGGVREMNTLQFKKLLNSGVLDKPVTGAEPQTKLVGRVRGLPQRRASEGPVDAASFLAAKGGIRNDEGHDLIKGRGLQQLIPGSGPLIRPGGMSIDYAGEALHEAGYFGPPEATERPTENEVLQFLERTRRGPDGKPSKVYAPEDQAEGATAKREAALVDEQNASALHDVHDAAKGMGTTLTDDAAHQIAIEAHTHGIDLESAIVEHLEREAIREENKNYEADTASQTQAEPVAAAESGPDRVPGKVSPEARPAAGAEGEKTAPGEPVAESPSEARPSVERGAEGFDQTIIPGGEQSARQLAAAREAQGKGRARSNADQKPADEGLFGDKPDDAQKAMFSLIDRGKEALGIGRSKTSGPTSGEKAGPRTEQVGVGADLKRLIDLFGPKMYGENMPNVTAKELLQNSFDAVKSALQRGDIKPGEGTIDVTFDRKNRELTFTDNGAGMTPEIVKSAFLTIAGTEKGDLAEAERSGGFGIAKLAFIFGNEGLHLETVRDGIKTTLKTSSKELLDGKAGLDSAPTREKNGTKVTVRFPEKVLNARTGEMTELYMPFEPKGFEALNKPLIGDVAVTANGDTKNPFPVGRNLKFDKPMSHVTTAHFPWGDVDVHLAHERTPYHRHAVLSSGLYQFDQGFNSKPGSYDNFPHGTVMNVRPSVGADSEIYPFNNQREGFSRKVTQDIHQLQAYFQKWLAAGNAGAVGAKFADVSAMPRTRASLRGTAEEFADLGLRQHLPETDSQFALERDISVKDGKVYIGGKGQDFKAELEKSKDLTKDKFKFPAGTVPGDKPLFHSNLNVDVVAEAARLKGIDPGNARHFLAGVGTLAQDFRDALAKVPGYQAWAAPDHPVGVSIDRDYHGVHIKVPFDGFFLNPLSVRTQTDGAIARSYLHTLIHEAVHTDVSGHDESFTVALSKLEEDFEEHNPGLKVDLEQRASALVRTHRDEFNAMREVYNDAGTKNAVSNADRNAREAEQSGRSDGVPGRALSGREADGDTGIRRGSAEDVPARDEGRDLQRPDGELSQPLFAKREGDTPGKALARFSPEFETERTAVHADLRKRLDALGLHDVALKVPDWIAGVGDNGERFPADGAYQRKAMAIALDTKDQLGTLDHEAVHAMRDMGLFTKSEWSMLENRAAKDWRARFNTDKRYGDLSEDKLNEEAVADAFKAWVKDQGTQKGTFARIFDKVRNTLAAIGSALRGRGFATPDSIFGKIERGEVGARPRGEAPGSGETQFAKQDEDKGAIFDRMAIDPARSTVEHLTDSSKTMVDRLKSGLSREAIGESIDRWRQAFQDRYLPMLRVQTAVEQKLGRRLAESENPYLKEELSTGRKGAKLEELSERMVRPLFIDMQDKGVTVPELETYLYARHAPERNARIEQINPKFRGDMLGDAKAGSGMSNEEASAIMDAAKSQGETAALEALAKRVDDILAYGVKERVEAGLLSPAEAEAWKATYQNYVPLRGHAELDPESMEGRPSTGRPLSVRGKESQRAFGRESKASDILAYSIMQAEEAIVRGENNRVAQSFHDLAKAAPNPEFWKVDKIENRPVWNKQSQQVEYRPVDRIAAEDAPYTVSTKINGVEHRVTLNRRNPMAVRLAQGMKSLGNDQTGMLLHTFGAVNRFLSHVNTTLNPEFVITNAFRDVQEAAINLNQYDVKGLVKNTLRDYPKALKGALQGAFKKGDGEWRKYYDEFREHGGRVYFNRTEDIPGLRTRIEKEVRDAKPGLTARKTIVSIFNLVENINTGVENGVRLSAYKNAREGGMSPDQAASLAKNLTINFNRRGTYGPLMNSLYLFYNASVQGSAVMLTALKSPTVRKIAYTAIATGAALEMMNSMASQKDKDGQLFYDKIDPYTKSHNLVIMDPTSEDGHFLKIPLPYGYGSFFAMGRAGAEAYRGKKLSDIASNLGSTLMDSFNPVGGAGNLLNLIAPTVIDPIVDLYRNRDYAERPIMPEQPQFGPKMPESQRYWGSVSPYFKGITDTLNQATGGDDVQPGKVDVSPEVLQYLFGTVTGAAGTFYERNADLVAKIMDPTSDLTWNDIPMARKLVGSKPAWVDKSAMYQRAEQIDQIKAEIRDYQKTGRPEQARALREQNHDLLSLSGRAQAAQDQLSMMRHQLAKAQRDYENGTITKDVYLAKKALIQDREKAVVERFNSAYVARVPSEVN